MTKNFFPLLWYNFFGSDIHTSYSVYDKRYDSRFPFVNFPWLECCCSRFPSYDINISQLVRFATFCTSVLLFHSKKKTFKSFQNYWHCVTNIITSFMSWVWVYWCFTSHATTFQLYMWRHRCAGGLTQERKLYIRSGSQRHRNFVGFLNVPVLHRHGTTLFIRWFRHTAPFSRLLRHAWDTDDVFSTLTPASSRGTSFMNIWKVLRVILWAFVKVL